MARKQKARLRGGAFGSEPNASASPEQYLPPELDVAGRGADAEGPIAIGIRVAKAIRGEDEEDEGVAIHPSEDASRVQVTLL